MMYIGCRAHIEKVHCHTKNGYFEVTVEVASESGDDPLEIYTKLDGESQHYLGPFHSNGPVTHAFRSRMTSCPRCPLRSISFAGRFSGIRYRSRWIPMRRTKATKSRLGH